MRLKRVISCFLHRWDAVKVCPKNLLCLITINSRGFHSFTVTVTQKNIFYDGLNFTFHCVMKHAFFVFYFASCHISVSTLLSKKHFVVCFWNSAQERNGINQRFYHKEFDHIYTESLHVSWADPITQPQRSGDASKTDWNSISQPIFTLPIV